MENPKNVKCILCGAHTHRKPMGRKPSPTRTDERPVICDNCLSRPLLSVKRIIEERGERVLRELREFHLVA